MCSSVGTLEPELATDEVFQIIEERKNAYRKLIVREGHLVGAMLVAGESDPDGVTKWIGFVAMILAAANVVGGFVVTDRMLEMFKKREKKPEP